MKFAEHVKVRQEKFGAVLFETLREKVFVANETGAEILRLLGEDKDPMQIVRELSLTHDSDPQTMLSDVEEFIGKLEGHGLLTGRI